MTVEIISEYLGVKPSLDGVVEPDKFKPFHYQNKNLQYAFFLDIEGENIAISADFQEPFGARSLFEISVEFDKVQIETEPSCYGSQKILTFRKDYPSSKNFKTLMVIKWDDGKLSVWPTFFKS